jgi:hypothetical protein
MAGRSRTSRSEHAQQQRNNENHEKDVEQDLRDLGSACCNPGKPNTAAIIAMMKKTTA